MIPALAAVVVLGAGGVGAAAAFSGDPAPAALPRAAASLTPPSGAAPAVTSPPAATPAASPSPTATAATGDPAPAASHRDRPAALVIAVPGRFSWVQVVRGSRVAFEGMLRHGHRLVYRRGPLTVTVGDAGAVRLVRHGHGHGRAGRPGQVLRFSVSR